MIKEGKEVTSIVYNTPTRNLVWGNPYFIDHPDSLKLIGKIRGDPEDSLGVRRLRGNLEYALARGESLLYLFALPYTRPRYRYRVQNYREIEAGVEWAKKNLPELVQVSQIPGTGVHYVRLRNRSGEP